MPTKLSKFVHIRQGQHSGGAWGPKGWNVVTADNPEVGTGVSAKFEEGTLLSTKSLSGDISPSLAEHNTDTVIVGAVRIGRIIVAVQVGLQDDVGGSETAKFVIIIAINS